MKITVKNLLLFLTIATLSASASAQSYSFSDSNVQQTGYQQQASPYYTSYGRQDELPQPSLQEPRLPGGNSGAPTDLPTPVPQPGAPLGSGVVSPPLPMENRTAPRMAPQPAPRMSPAPRMGPDLSPYPAPPANLTPPPTMNLNSGGPMYGQPMSMPSPYQQAPCCPDHGAVPQAGSAMGVPMNFDSGYNQSSVLMEPIQQPMISTPAMMSMDDGCSCGSDCGGGCASNMGLGNGSLGLGSFGIGSGLGSGLGGLSQGGPMYAFFDFGVNFSENDSFFSDAVAGQLRGRPFGHKDAFIFGAGLGRYITSDMRVDFGARYRHLELEDQIPDSNGFGYLADGGNSVWTGMVTARHNLPGFHPCIKPYFSLGGGLAYHRAQASSWITGPSVSGFPQAHLSEETTEFAWSVGGGVAFKMTSNMFFDVDYQYIDMGDAATGTDTSGRSMQFGSLTANEVVFRLRYNF